MELEGIHISEGELPHASGGYAKVYKRTYQGKSVAVKVIQPESISRAEIVAKVCVFLFPCCTMGLINVG